MGSGCAPGTFDPILTRSAALRFVKSCLKTPNHFMHRHYTKNDLLLPLVVLLEEEGGKDNMLSSSCLDVLEAIRKVREDGLEPC